MYKIGIDDNYKNNIYTNDAIHSLVIKINNNIIDSKYVRKLQKQHDILAGEKLSIGSACSQCITLQLDYDALNNIQEINEVYIEENVIIGDSTYKIPLGYFYLSNNGIDSTNKAYATLKLYDKLYTLNIPYSTSSEFIENNNKTRLQIVQDICAKNGMYLETTNFLGYDKIDNVYNDDMTYQNWLVFISERAGGFCRVGREKNSSGLIPLSIISLTDLETNIIPNNMLGNFVEGNTFTISKVATSIITNYGDDTGTTIFLSADNILPLTNNDVEEIYNKIKNVTFQNFEVKTWGDSTIDAGDFIQIGDYKTIAEIDMDYANGYYGTYKFNKQLPESDTEIVKIQSSGNKRYTKKRIEELENGYKFVVQSVEDLEKEVTTIKETSGNNSLYIEDALESRVLEYGIDGKSEQETRSGKNLFDINNQYKVGQSFTYNGITITYNENGYITLNGTASANGDINIVPKDYTITLDKDIYLCLEKVSGSISVDKGFTCQAINKSGESIWTYAAKESAPIKKVPYSDIVSIRWLRIQITSGIVFTNYKIRCWVSTENSLDFEPYGASPSPDFPSEIKSVEGIRNLFDKDNTLDPIHVGTEYVSTDYIPVKNGDTLYKTNGFMWWFYDSSKQELTSKSGSNSIIVDIDNVAYARCNVLVSELDNFMFTINQPLPNSYVPYGNWLKVQTTGKNICPTDISMWESGQYGTSGNKENNTRRARTINLLPVLQDTYFANCSGYSTIIRTYDKNKNFVRSLGIVSTFTINENEKYISVTLGENTGSVTFETYQNGFVNGTIQPFIYLNSEEDKTFEPYKENITLIDLKNNELCSIGDIKDQLIISEDGSTRIEKKFGEVVLDGSESTWVTLSDSTDGYKRFRYLNTNIANVKENLVTTMSDKLLGVNYLDNKKAPNVISQWSSSNIFTITTDSKTYTLDEWKTYLSNNNIKVQYVLAEPYTIDLGQVDISLFENINHINLLEDIETDTRVKYLINNVMNGTYATKGELELTNEQFQTTITNEFNSLERQMTSITQTGGAIDIAVQKANKYTDNQNSTLSSRITDTEANYTDLSGRVETMEGKVSAMNFSFMTKGLQIMEKDKAGNILSNIYSLLDNKGLRIYNIDKLIAIFNQYGSGFKKLIAEESIQIQNLLIQKRTMNTPKANNMDVISFFFNTQETTIEKIEELDK